jgi:putative transposase
MSIETILMKIVVKIQDVVALARRFEESPRLAMSEVIAQVQAAASHTLERVMEAEIALFLGQPAEASNKRNGFVTRTFAFKGLGTVQLRVPRDRAGRFRSNVVPPSRRYDPLLEKDLALLHLAGVSTRMLSYVAPRVLGVRVSPQEVSNSLDAILPAAKRFLERPLGDRRFMHLYVDGTFFPVRRTTVEREPTLVVLGVDEGGHKSVLSLVQGDKDSKTAWEMVFADLKSRGLDPSAVRLGIMDGLAGLGDAFTQAFPRAKAARCWFHKAKNVFPLVPKRYQAEFKSSWDAVAYAESKAQAELALNELERRWRPLCDDAVTRLVKDRDGLLVHYEFPREHWDALRTTNPIERVNKELKRRAKAMETVSADGLKALLAFTSLRLEYGWATTPITSPKIKNLEAYNKVNSRLDRITRELLQ